MLGLLRGLNRSRNSGRVASPRGRYMSPFLQSDQPPPMYENPMLRSDQVPHRFMPAANPMGNHIISQNRMPAAGVSGQFPQYNDPYFGYGDQFQWQGAPQGANPRHLGGVRVFPEGHTYDMRPPDYNQNPGYWRDRENRAMGQGQGLYQKDTAYWDKKYADDLQSNNVPRIIGDGINRHETLQEYMGVRGDDWLMINEKLKWEGAKRYAFDQANKAQGHDPYDWNAVQRQKLEHARMARTRERAWLDSKRRQ